MTFFLCFLRNRRQLEGSLECRVTQRSRTRGLVLGRDKDVIPVELELADAGLNVVEGTVGGLGLAGLLLATDELRVPPARDLLRRVSLATSSHLP